MTINNILAIILLSLVIPGLWVSQALGLLNLAPEVTGALIATWTLIVQYYFRKKPGGN